MRTWLYVAIPAVAFALILSNAFYGHHVFASSHPENISKFSIYVRLQSEWNSHPGNLLFEVTNVWDDTGALTRTGDSTEQDGHNYNHVKSIGDRPFVELKHSFDDCRGDWQPVLYRYGIDMLRNQLEALGGADISGHPYAVMYPDRPGPAPPTYVSGYVQFVPACSPKDVASYQYSVRSNDPNVILSVFFVPDQALYEQFIRDPFDLGESYAGQCMGEAYASFSGTCTGVPQGGGLLIWVPDDLDMALTKITVNLREVQTSAQSTPAS